MKFIFLDPDLLFFFLPRIAFFLKCKKKGQGSFGLNFSFFVVERMAFLYSKNDPGPIDMDFYSFNTEQIEFCVKVYKRR